MTKLPLTLSNSPNNAALGAYGSVFLEDGTVNGRFYALKAITDVVVTAITSDEETHANHAALVGKTINTGDTLVLFPITAITVTGCAQLFRAE